MQIFFAPTSVLWNLSCPVSALSGMLSASVVVCTHVDGKARAQFTLVNYSGWPKVLQAAMVPLSKPVLNQRIRCWEEP